MESLYSTINLINKQINKITGCAINFGVKNAKKGAFMQKFLYRSNLLDSSDLFNNNKSTFL